MSDLPGLTMVQAQSVVLLAAFVSMFVAFVGWLSWRVGGSVVTMIRWGLWRLGEYDRRGPRGRATDRA